jgi:ParB family chromosome partitioning protein
MTKSSTRRALGRGLTALIPQDSEEKGSNNEIVLVDSNAIKENPFQPRVDFNQEEIAGLAESIKAQGLLQPILLRKKTNGYEIISGERRFRACKILGYDRVPAIVKPQVADREMLELALVENIQREDLNEIEEARGYQRLLLECGLSHEQLSERVGKSRSVVTNTLRLLKLPDDIQEMIRNGGISAGHARALLAIDNAEKQRELANRIRDDKLTVRAIEELGKKTGAPAGPAKKGAEKKAAAPRDPDLTNQIEQLQYRFGTAVDITTTPAGAGTISIKFYSKDDLNRILDIFSKCK